MQTEVIPGEGLALVIEQYLVAPAIVTGIKFWLKELTILWDALRVTQVVRAAAEDQEAIGVVIVSGLDR